MSAVTAFIRNTPKASLAAYFAHTGIALSPPVNWDMPGDIVRPVLQAVDEMDPITRDRVETVAERVTGMADEAGETAIYSVARDPGFLDTLSNRYARALWMFINDATGFRHAEEVRYTDEKRHRRIWDGFVGEPNLEVRRDTGSIETFKAAIRDRFQSNNVHIDLFDRQRAIYGESDCELVQAAVYREGRPDDVLEFVDGALDLRPRRPVFEAAITYEAATGVIEVVANDRDSREDMVRMFARDLLASEFRQERLPFRHFSLEPLLQPFTFPTDIEDGIESVRVSYLRLMPIDTVGERVGLECMRQATRTIWDMATERFGASNPLLGGWVITQAKFTIRFHPEPGTTRGKTLPLTITMPHGCDLKGRTERERMIGDKYLRRWGILRDV
jgi:hypothetical protein